MVRAPSDMGKVRFLQKLRLLWVLYHSMEFYFYNTCLQVSCRT